MNKKQQDFKWMELQGTQPTGIQIQSSWWVERHWLGQITMVWVLGSCRVFSWLPSMHCPFSAHFLFGEMLLPHCAQSGWDGEIRVPAFL